MQAPVKKHVSSSRHATGKVTVANWVLPLASCVKHSADFSPLKRSKVMVSDRLWGVQLIKPMNAPKYGIICEQSRGCCK